MPPFFEPLTPDYYGRGPHKTGPDGKLRAGDPFAYAGSERDANGNARGYSAGFGLMSGRADNGARADVMQAQGHFGGWRDENGRTNVGAELDGAVARVGLERGNGLGPIGFDVEALSANAGAKVNEETASIGAQANLVAGSISAGTDEHNMRFGGSIGVGLAGRAHYGDADGDGVPEAGFGFDAGPVSFDVKSELLGHGVNAAKRAGSAIASGASSLWNGIRSW